MDATIRSTRLNRDELAKHVHRPVFKRVEYQEPDYMYQQRPFPFECNLPSYNFMALQEVINNMDIENDPWIIQSRARFARLPPGKSKSQLDQKLSKTIAKQDTSTHRGLREFLTAASAICVDIGPWAADWYISKVIEKAKAAGGPFQHIVRRWQDTEKHYLLEALEKVPVIPVLYDPTEICAGSNHRLNVLIESLMNEKMDFESNGMEFSGIIFVTRRDAVIALAEVLQHHPFTKDVFRVGSLLGNSSDSRRTSFLDITRSLITQTTAETLADFKLGYKNLIVSTSVAEEGIDVQSCCSVIRWDLPQNMISWAQSRGRARKKKSTFVIMTAAGQDPSVLRWEEMENRMVELYNDPSRDFQEEVEEDEESDGEEMVFRVEKTG